MKLNENLLNFENDNLFSNVTKKVNEYKKEFPDKKILSLGIGDVSKPIVKPVIDAMINAVNDLSDMKTFKGYGAYYGYDFLKEIILKNDYTDFGFCNDEIYISNGTKTDSTSILELFDTNSKILISDPLYPIYRDGAKALSKKLYTIKANELNNFIPQIPKEKYDIIYLCSPNNPTGIAMTYDELKPWVDYALQNNSIILYDNVYEAFIENNNVPKSIYEIENSKKVAIEFRSFSKKASFTGVRCSYYIIPKEIKKDINIYWKRRTMNRFNGADYIAQRGAEATYFEESKALINENIKYFKDNAMLLLNTFCEAGFETWGGKDAPFIWVKTKNNLSSWEMFNIFLKELNIVIIPGIIFGNNGDKYFRVSALGRREDVIECIEKIRAYYIN